MNLEGKCAVVTGASRGIGKNFSESLIAKGADVIGIARKKEGLDQLKETLGDSFHVFPADVGSEEEIKGVFSDIKSSFDHVDILINNAGVGRFGNFEDATSDDWDTQINVNLKGVFLCTREVIPLMKAQNDKTGFGGHIVNIASIAGIMGVPRLGIYNATKFGLRGFSESLMKEIRYDGIKVSCVYPGSIETGFFDDIDGIDAHSRMMQPEDIAGTVMHLLEAPENYLISEVVMRPFRPKKD